MDSNWDYTFNGAVTILRNINNTNMDTTGDDNENIADKYKLEGNEYAKSKDYGNAIQCYTKAINYIFNSTDGYELPDDAHNKLSKYYCNRALCYLKLNRYDACINDCNSSIKHDDMSIKSYFRRAQCWEHKNELNKALKDYQMFRQMAVITNNSNFISIAIECVTKIRQKMNKYNESKTDIKSESSYDSAINDDDNDNNVPQCRFWPNCSRKDCRFYHPTSNNDNNNNNNNNDSNDDAFREDSGDEYENVSRIRCRYYPNCTKPNCLYYHPTSNNNSYIDSNDDESGQDSDDNYENVSGIQCRYYPNCTKPNCPYDHPKSDNDSNDDESREDSDDNYGNVSGIHCRYYPNCTKPNCPYYHPKSIHNAARDTNSEADAYQNDNEYLNASDNNDDDDDISDNNNDDDTSSDSPLYRPVTTGYSQNYNNNNNNNNNNRSQYNKSNTLCKFYPHCSTINCPYYHPKNTYPSKTRKCKYGYNCNNNNCTFDHS